MSNDSVARWLDAPEDHDYPPAASYLSLKAAPAVTFKAKDVLRAAGLSLLATDNPP